VEGRGGKKEGEIKEIVDTSLMSDRYHDENAVSNRAMAVDSSWLLLLDCQFRGVFHGILFSSPLLFLFYSLQYEISLTRPPTKILSLISKCLFDAYLETTWRHGGAHVNS